MTYRLVAEFRQPLVPAGINVMPTTCCIRIIGCASMWTCIGRYDWKDERQRIVPETFLMMMHVHYRLSTIEGSTDCK